jgi:predicted nucleotidyltransferase
MLGGLSEYTINTITAILAKRPAIKEAILFGSRAKGNYREGSDIDLSLITDDSFGYHDLLHLKGDFDDSNLPYYFDVNILKTLKNESLRDHITRVGKVLYKA